jgi:methanogenic corrinoid protein MtbC1
MKASGHRHPIQVAARRSGLSQDVIRAWERRYGAVKPNRSGTKRRLYSDEDVERLFLLARVTRAGRRIGDVAKLPLKQLQEMADSDLQAESRVAVSVPSSRKAEKGRLRESLARCLDAVSRLDPSALERALAAAAVDLSPSALTEQLLMPLMREIGERWHSGELRVAHEHMATAIVRSFMGIQSQNGRLPESAPNIVIATPAGQRHELGALMASIAASSDGWRVTYLGCDVPAGEIAAAARQKKARAVALSIIYPADDPQLARELKALGKMLGDEAPVLVGGSAAGGYEKTLEDIGARLLPSVDAFREALTTLRHAPPA